MLGVLREISTQILIINNGKSSEKFSKSIVNFCIKTFIEKKIKIFYIEQDHTRFKQLTDFILSVTELS